MSTPTLETLQKQLAEYLKRINALEKQVETMRKRTNIMLNGHSAVLVRIIGHTGCRPPQGTEFDIILNADVGG